MERRLGRFGFGLREREEEELKEAGGRRIWGLGGDGGGAGGGQGRAAKGEEGGGLDGEEVGRIWAWEEEDEAVVIGRRLRAGCSGWRRGLKSRRCSCGGERGGAGSGGRRGVRRRKAGGGRGQVWGWLRRSEEDASEEAWRGGAGWVFAGDEGERGVVRWAEGSGEMERRLGRSALGCSEERERARDLGERTRGRKAAGSFGRLGRG